MISYRTWPLVPFCSVQSAKIYLVARALSELSKSTVHLDWYRAYLAVQYPQRYPKRYWWTVRCWYFDKAIHAQRWSRCCSALQRGDLCRHALHSLYQESCLSEWNGPDCADCFGAGWHCLSSSQLGVYCVATFFDSLEFFINLEFWWNEI